MAAYMRNQFTFLGIGAPERRRLVRSCGSAFGPLDETTLHDIARLAWELPEREYQYVAAELLCDRIGDVSAETTLPVIAWLITTKPWWDTVDVLCRHGAGELVRRERPAIAVVDRWLDGGDRWLIRSAILHQERWGREMEWEWISAACRSRAEHDDFFVRKAIGWVLRTYAHRGSAEADAVRRLLTEASFSGLTRREALRRVQH